MKFFYHLLSQPSRALYIFLKTTKIPFQGVVVDLAKGEHYTDEFQRINRFQKVPCIVDDDQQEVFKLSESVAIFRYLMEKNPDVPENWYPKNIQERALVDEYLEWQHNNTRLFGAMFFRTKFLEPKMFQKPVNEKKVQMYFNGLQQTLDTLESTWLGSESKNYLASEKISFADILCAAEIEQTRVAEFDPFQGRPRLREWWYRVKKETNPYYDEAHEIVYKLIKKQAKL